MTTTPTVRLLSITVGTALLAACGRDATSTLGPETLPRAASMLGAKAGVTQRPVEDFLAAQGTFCIDPSNNCDLITAPVPEFISWFSGSFATTGIVDYAGMANTWLQQVSGGAISLGTTVEGSVTERALKGGGVEVHVILRTTNALTWAGDGGYLAGDPVWFGSSATQVLAGATPVLGSSTLDVKFVTTAAGLPMPDLVQIAFAPEPGQGPLQVEFHAQANGDLHAGSGFPEGTTGRLLVHQVGIFRTKSPSKAENPFVVEIVDLKATH